MGPPAHWDLSSPGCRWTGGGMRLAGTWGLRAPGVCVGTVHWRDLAPVRPDYAAVRPWGGPPSASTFEGICLAVPVPRPETIVLDGGRGEARPPLPVYLRAFQTPSASDPKMFFLELTSVLSAVRGDGGGQGKEIPLPRGPLPEASRVPASLPHRSLPARGASCLTASTGPPAPSPQFLRAPQTRQQRVPLYTGPRRLQPPCGLWAAGGGRPHE